MKCVTCRKVFTNETFYKRHRYVSRDRQSNVASFVVGVLVFLCLLELIILSADIITLQIHDPEYWDRFKCQTCQRPFRDAHALKNHMQLHDGIKPHMCDLCGRTYNRFANMVCELVFFLHILTSFCC
jgi:uncharacterized Zn-finger protein